MTDQVTYSQIPICDRRWNLMRMVPDGRQVPSRYLAESEPIHLWFGLTYANYMALPRSVLQSMPREWQQAFCDLLEDLDDAFGYLDWPKYRVSAVNNQGRFIRDPIPHYDRGRTRVPHAC